jgi:rSAM/selenodomain-associated transferase 1
MFGRCDSSTGIGSHFRSIRIALGAVPTAVIMLKAPVPGMVKTRLAAALGPEEACAIYRRMVERVISELPAAWPLEVHGTPPEQMPLLAAWLGPRPRYRTQSEGDLGERLIQASEAAFASGADSVVLLGGDCPWQTRAIFQECVKALVTHDVVIGPACDGGYTLLAAKNLHRPLFEGIAWSTASVLADTLARASVLGLRVALLEPLEDVDDLPAWQRARAKLFADSLE